MVKFYMLVGLPASGKSTYAEKLAKTESAIICSSDDIRKTVFGDEADQTHNDEVFNLLHKKVLQELNHEQNVIYDATNTTLKSRKAILESIKNINCEKIAVFFATPVDLCLSRNKQRDRQVPEHVIKRMYNNFNVPCKQEGFSELRIIYPEGFTKTPFKTILETYKNISHDNPHHLETIGQHMQLACDYFVEKYEKLSITNFIDYVVLYYAAALHDIGKPQTKAFVNKKGESTEIAHFYSHNNVGAYEIFLTDVPEQIKFTVALLIQYHMHYFMSWKQSEKAKQRDIKFLGDDIFNKLEILHECDINARNCKE